MLALLGTVASVSVHAWLGYVAIPVCLVLAGWRAILRAPMIAPIAASAIAATALVHAVFFGAGRYGLVVAPLVAGLAFAEGRARGAVARATLSSVDAARAIVRGVSAPREESPSSAEHDAG